MDIRDIINDADEALCKEVLCSLLERYLQPAFGSLTKREIDLLLLEALQKIEFIESDPTLYALVKKLRVTRSRARNLYYDLELRRLDLERLDAKVKEALKAPLIQKQGDLFALEIENPLVSDHLRAILQSLGHTTDGSFSPSLVKLTRDAFIALMANFMDEGNQVELRQALIAAGFPDDSLRGLLKSALRKLGTKIAEDAGGVLAEQVSDYLTPMIDGAFDRVRILFEGLLRDEQGE